MNNKIFFVGCALCLLAGCRQDDITVARISKSSEPAPTMDMSQPAPSEGRSVQWKVPASWQEQPASGMRVGSFLVTGKNGQKADVSVVSLSGSAGGDLANINRWRGQINLNPLSESELSKHSQPIRPAGRPMLFVDFTSQELLIENQYKKRLLAAIFNGPNQTWFFKMTGEDATVREAKPAFLQFLESLTFESPDHE